MNFYYNSKIINQLMEIGFNYNKLSSSMPCFTTKIIFKRYSCPCFSIELTEKN